MEESRRASALAHAAMDQTTDHTVRAHANVPDLLRSVLTFYDSRLRSAGIHVSTRYCWDGDLSVYARPLRQAMANLLLNALDAMPEGGRVIARVARAQEWAAPGRHGLRVTIADSGCGINPDHMSRLSENFFTTKGRAGNGLGLSFVRDAVQEHGGALRIRSSTRAGRSGSVFSFFLPSMT